ncbi:MAG: DUF5522 domain-containing protein [Pseudomonadota bacterium]
MPETDYWALHQAACERGETTYTDPETGFMVFTRLGLLERDRCCGAGCRHCPFGHESVGLSQRAKRIQQAAWLTEARPDLAKETALLFWSGGKDSFLAYRALEREQKYSIVLVTTFDARSRIIAHQEFPIDDVLEQAKQLDIPLIGIPLHSGPDYVDQIVPALDLVPDCKTLCFGDLHLEHIRKWREEAFDTHERTKDMALELPIWKVDYDALLEDLVASGAECRISAIASDLPGIAVGDRFDADLIARLPRGVDAFGENGEFHTRIMP